MTIRCSSEFPFSVAGADIFNCIFSLEFSSPRISCEESDPRSFVDAVGQLAELTHPPSDGLLFHLGSHYPDFLSLRLMWMSSTLFFLWSFCLLGQLWRVCSTFFCGCRWSIRRTNSSAFRWLAFPSRVPLPWFKCMRCWHFELLLLAFSAGEYAPHPWLGFIN